MNTTEFRIVNNMKKFILSLDNILINFPKKAKVLKDKREWQQIIISKMSMLDFYFEEAFRKEYISEKQCKNKCNELLSITKMLYGWIKTNKS